MKSWPIVQVRQTSNGCRVCFASSLSMLWSQQRRSVPCHGPYGALVQCQLSECKQIESILWQHLYHSFRNEGCKICCSSRMWPGINIRQSEPDRTPQSCWGNCVGWVLRNHQYYVSLPGGYGVSVETSSCSEGTISVWNCCFHPEEAATSSDFSPSLNCNAMQHLQAISSLKIEKPLHCVHCSCCQVPFLCLRHFVVGFSETKQNGQLGESQLQCPDPLYVSVDKLLGTTTTQHGAHNDPRFLDLQPIRLTQDFL